MPRDPHGIEKRIDLVFEGGGVKGIGLVGALSVLSERGFQPQNLAGTSAGAIVAALLAAGYTPEELRKIILGLDYRSLQDEGWEDRLPLINRTASLLLDQGLYEGWAFLRWMSELLAAKNVEHFSDLVHPEFADDPRYRHRLQVIASDVSERRLLVLPRDARKLGVAPDALSVALAVRMSMSIPIFFEPVRWTNPETGGEHLIVDGGMLSNFPVWLFDTDDVPAWPTFGLLLVEPDPRTSVATRLERPVLGTAGIGAFLEYLKSLVQTMMEAHDRLYVEQADFARTIPIPTLGVRTTEFDLSRERALALYQSGVSAAEEFLEAWDFEQYVTHFRQSKRRSRRAVLAEQFGRNADRGR